MQKLCTGPDNCGRPSIKRALLNKSEVQGASVGNHVGKKQMRPGPATRAAWYVDFLARFSRRAGRCSRSESAPLRGVPLLPERAADHDFHHRSASTAGTSGPILFKDRMRRRPQCPGNQHALTRGLECPRRLRWLCRNHPASSRRVHVFTADTLRQGRVACNRKTTSACAEAVKFAD